MKLQIEELSAEDLTAARRLSTDVGWNQTVADWRRLLDLFSDTCFGGWVGDRLVATSTLATYENRVGWIGMILVDEAHRRQGYGSAIFEAALEAGRRADLEAIGLDATDAGRRVYASYGFERTGGIDRWRGTLNPPASECCVKSDNQKRTVEFGDTEQIASFDANRCEVNRVPLLRHLLDSEGTIGIRSIRDGKTDGYAVVRPGRTCPHVGPVVADDRDAFERVLSGVAPHVSGSVIVDAFRRDTVTTILEEAGLNVGRRLHRMTHGKTRPALDSEDVMAAAGFEWG